MDSPKAEIQLRTYLDLDRDYEDLLGRLPCAGDSLLGAARECFPGLRILRQPLDETLLCFICSANKRISQIRRMVSSLAERMGASLTPQHRRLPTWEEIAGAGEDELRRCGLGYRASHLHRTALFLSGRPEFLPSAAKAPYGEALAQMRELPGVGEKVAACTLLFGAGRFEAFPRDTWILSVLRHGYGLHDRSDRDLRAFAEEHFQPAPGLAQQLLFAYARRFPEAIGRSVGK